jgi:predicted DNA-binding transcriptional regulator YafY
MPQALHSKPDIYCQVWNYIQKMRAARVLEMLLVLQRSGRTTAQALSERLEVSERTILRDVEALGSAGVPIFTTRGSNGGIELMDGFQTHLTGLTTDESACLFLIGQPLIAHRLGLGAPARSARIKLINALPAALGEEANRLGAWFLNDPDPERGNRIPHGELRRIVRAINQRREIELTIENNPTIRMRPLGLVLKAGSWNLVVSGKFQAEVICIDDLRSTRLTTQSFAPPANFDLQQTWSACFSK